jgi:hypothetical protein
MMNESVHPNIDILFSSVSNRNYPGLCNLLISITAYTS